MRLFKLGIVLSLLVFATCAFASTVTFSYTGVGLDVTGSLNGTFNAGVFTATSGSGLYNLTPMTLTPTSVGGATGFNFDNVVFFPPVGGYHVDYLGLVFDVTGLGYVNLCATIGCIGSNEGYTNLTSFAGNTSVEATFSSPTPEPSTLLMMGSGLVGLAGWARKRLFS